MAGRALVLASASPARLRLLRDAGLDPRVVVSGVDESAVRADDPAVLVGELARRKAVAVATSCTDELIVGCDSLLVLDGEVFGKASSPAEVVTRWRRFAGRQAQLLTGHCVIDCTTGAAESAVGSTAVRFGRPDEDELAAYASTEEALAVAGPFTIDGRAAAFVEGIDGDPGNVVGLSLPLLRELLRRLDVRLTDLWC